MDKKYRFVILFVIVMGLLIYWGNNKTKENKAKALIEKQEREQLAEDAKKEYAKLTPEQKRLNQEAIEQRKYMSYGLTESKIDAVEVLIEKSLLKFNLSENAIYISSLVWNAYDYPGKKEFAKNLTNFVLYKSGEKEIVLHFLDLNTGKEIAEYSNIDGDLEVK